MARQAPPAGNSASPAEGGEELYDHENDPNEHTNLADSPAYASIKAGLAGRLAQALTFGPSLLASLTTAAPQDGEQLSGRDIVLTAAASDPDDGDLSVSIQWSSDIDGPISSPANLSVGHHVTTAAVTDSDGQIVTRQINLRVREARDDYVAADMNGSGLVTAADFNLLRARLNTAPGPSALACAGAIPCPSP